MGKHGHKGFAVFTRNHLDYLKEAVAIAEKRPTEKITFRASKRWVKACEVVRSKHPIHLYIAPIGGTGVQYVAELHERHLDPTSGAPKTTELLARVLESTRKEGLWDGNAKTLYVIANCRKVRKIPLIELRKVSDDQPLSSDYSYSYSLVHVHESI